jgi:perosamine synthetase
VAVNSGTSALHLCIRSLDIKEGDEVITTPFSFIASANCILFEKAKPVFVDIEEDTLCLDADKIEEKITPKTKAILPVHVFGQPCKMDKITSVARKHNLSVIEDACEAIGAQYKHKKVGSFGDAGVFAFYPNKQITTAEGGMIVTDDEKIAKLCRSMRNQGREDDTDWLCHKRLGYNYRMSELSAALGVAQVERIDEILEKRQKVAGSYNERLQAIEGIIVPHAPGDARISWFVYVIRLDVGKFSLEDRNRIMQRLRERGISCSNYFPPIHLEPLYIELFGYKGGDFPVTEAVSRSTISLPFFNNLNKNDIEYTCNTLRDIIRRPYG